MRCSSSGQFVPLRRRQGELRVLVGVLRSDRDIDRRTFLVVIGDDLPDVVIHERGAGDDLPLLRLRYGDHGSLLVSSGGIKSPVGVRAPTGGD